MCIRDRDNAVDSSAIAFRVDGSDYVTIGSDGNLNIISGELVIPDVIRHRNDANTKIRFPDDDTITAETGGSERVRINSGGKILVGHTTARGIGGSQFRQLQIEGTSAGDSGISMVRNSADASPPSLNLGKSRASSVGGTTIVQDGDALGNITFSGADGTNLQTNAAVIRGEVDGTPGENDMPGRLVFKTTADGAEQSTERLRITSSGQVFIGNGVTSSYDMVLLRNTNGNVVSQIVNTNTGSSTQAILQLQVGSNKYANLQINHANEYLQLNGSNITTAYYDFNDHKFRNNSGTEGFTIDSAGSCNIKGGNLTLSRTGAENKIEVGSGQNANHYAYIDFVGDTTYSDHGLRLIRGNDGANAGSSLIQRGTGALTIVTQEAANLEFKTTNTTRMMIHDGGTVNIPGSVDGQGLMHIGSNTSSYLRFLDLASEDYGPVSYTHLTLPTKA